MRVTERAQHAVLNARREAGRLGHDRVGTEYVNWHSSVPSFGMVRIHQRTFAPSPPADTELLELRFSRPDTMPKQAPSLIVSTVDLR